MKNAWKFLAGCGCLSVIAGAAMIAVSFVAADKLGGLKSDDLAHYQNTREGRTGNLSENYVDFSFDYPKTWTVKTTDPDNINFVTVENKVDDKTYENLNVGYFSPAPTPEQNQELFHQVQGQLEGQYAQQLRDFRKVSEGPSKVGNYDAHEALYDGWVDAQGQRVNVFLRVLFVTPPAGGKGVSMMMIGTSHDPDLKEVNDLATKGELPAVLESFKFGS
jgi:hypothetical protein